MRVIAYSRCSTREQADSGLGLAAQRRAIQEETDKRGWEVVRWIEDVQSGKTLDRPGLQEALGLLGIRRRKLRVADALVVAKLDRASRSVADFAGLMERADRQQWSFVALDLNIDTTTPSGEFMANILAALGRWERRIISTRTKAALAERKAAGVRLGRERMTDPAVVARIVAASVAGEGPTAIARALDADAIPTPNGGVRWYPMTVRRLLAAERAREPHSATPTMAAGPAGAGDFVTSACTDAP